MLMIFTALYCEAEPLLQYYHLKKNNSINKFQVFQNDDMLLAVTNPGSTSAAVCTTYLCTLYPPKASDAIINIGICAASDGKLPAGSIFLCNKVTEETTGRSFYPDIIFRHPFPECEIITCSKVVNASDIHTDTARNTMLFDMEAAGIYQAAACFAEPHQISFIKIVSDNGAKDKLSLEAVTGLVEKNLNGITKWLDTLKQMKHSDSPYFSTEEEGCFKKLADHLHCSVTMEYKLRQQLYYYKLIHGSFTKAVNDIYSDNRLPCRTKAEGKIYFEQLKERLL